ncbi:SpoIIE family protein phosphatase [Streptomyces sp. HNM0645]|uniref:PP2C family protein-serine/threonine phosphatase n=1 Tax=Streptomyces sp. HNM0645 TaxID=2782343 RepID=UPI0024B82C88|nr:SpoIIE family protein phosphatase [Streptomyces sp. HNM0645]MDI9885829.1 SpoIIE family protein phosphatase [Streptomyces sp. HNM0645]
MPRTDDARPVGAEEQVPVPREDVRALKRVIEQEIAGLRADVGGSTPARATRPSPVSVPAGDAAVPRDGGPIERAHGQDRDAGAGAADGGDPWAYLTAALPAVPLATALLAPVWDDGRGEEGAALVDFVIAAGNRVRSAEWLEPLGLLVGQRLLTVRPGAASAGLVEALARVLRTGRPLHGWALDYTERREGRLRRVQLLCDAAASGDRILATWRPALTEADLLTSDAEKLVSLGWGNWDLLSGATTWSDGLHRIFRTAPGRTWSLTELCDALLPDDVPRFAQCVRTLLAGTDTPWTRIRFVVGDEVRTLDVLGRPLAGTDGRPWAIHLVARDLTPQMRSLRRLAETRRETEVLRQQAAVERKVASRLREALLPTHSARLAEAGIAVAAAYLPSEREAAVGGDWYKCRLLADGRVLLAIGDASGRGLEAVARMAQQRHALAGLAQTGADPGAMATWLNQMMCGDPSALTATAVVGSIEHRTLHWACAGHPPPVLRRGGGAALLPGDHAGPLLGLIPGYVYEIATVPLEPDDLLLLYTDGLIERRGEDIEDSLGGLVRSLAREGPLSPEETVDALVSAHTAPGLEDDACLLALRID